MLVQIFGVDEDTAQTALQCSGGSFAVAGQLLCQERQREAAQQAVLQTRDEERQAAQAAAARARLEEREVAQEATREATREAAQEATREAVRDALECVLCMEAPKTHIFAPCGHRACEGCVEKYMQPDGRCPTCDKAVKSTLRMFD